jgi:hypothetical protein
LLRSWLRATLKVAPTALLASGDPEGRPYGVLALSATI